MIGEVCDRCGYERCGGLEGWVWWGWWGRGVGGVGVWRVVVWLVRAVGVVVSGVNFFTVMFFFLQAEDGIRDF